MLATPCGQVDANLQALRVLIRGPELKHFKLVCAKRIGDAAALVEVVREIVPGGRIADSDSHENPSAASAARAALTPDLPRRTAGTV
jgi:hypothetical protein